MANANVSQEVVTKFLLDTCRLHRGPTFYTVGTLSVPAAMGTGRLSHDNVDYIPLTTGSAAELYIEPMLSCIGDVDIMYHESNRLAIPAGTVPPTQLPGEFESAVLVDEIVDSEFPGYVYLVLSYLLTEDAEDEKYKAEQCERLYMGRKLTDVNRNHGPAAVFESSIPFSPAWGLGRICGSRSSRDIVHCVRCLVWPPQSRDWPARPRNYGWPDSATVDRVISNGCDVVQVAHRQYRQHTWMAEFQHRLSFSRAEIALLNSWMPVQQIVYHVQRVFLKSKQLTGSDSMLNNYNTKTLMLWSCELKPNSWWIDDFNVVRISVELLNILGVWMNDGRCKHFFINNCNLFDQYQTCDAIANILTSCTEESFTEWFVNTYIQLCAQFCPDNVSRLFDDISTTVKLQNAVSSVVSSRQKELLSQSFDLLAVVQHITVRSISDYSVTVRSCLWWMKELPKTKQSLNVYFIAVVFLHAAHKISRNPLEEELFDVLATLILNCSDAHIRRCRNAQHSSVLSLSQAAKLMKVIANNSLSTVQLIQIELSKAYLYRALRCKDSDNDSIYCLANVYLAVLYYTTGQYPTAINYCRLVTRSQDHSQCSSHVLEGELLLKIDDDIDNVLGLSVLYQYVRTCALNQQRKQHVSAFTTELFAQYLHSRCMMDPKAHLLEEMSPIQHDQIQRYRENLCELPDLFITDILGFISLSLNCANNAHYPTTSRKPLVVSPQHVDLSVKPDQLNTSELIELLQKSAIEHLTTFRETEARDFGSVGSFVTTDFEAMYAYKRGDYRRCLQLCIHNICSMPLGCCKIASHLSELPYALPEFIQLLDDDIASLTALTLMVNPKCRDDGPYICISQRTLSLHLIAQCQIKLHQSVTSLSQTLNYIKVERQPDQFQSLFRLDKLLLKLTERKILLYKNSHLA